MHYGLCIQHKTAMKKYKKTYAILNLSEKHTIFHLGKTKVHVSFTGGIVTKQGVTPATFTTDNPVVQLAIENSDKFKKGEVTLLTQYPMQGDVKIGRNEPEEAPHSGPGGAEAPMQSQIMDGETPEDKQTPAAIVPVQPADAAEPEVSTGTAESGLEVIEVSCKDVAKQYLQEHYDEKPAPLRTIADVQECAAKHGITFSFV